mmetsp:Transcript_3751/g.6264  ORF Transcript_3751/g.6264 Transcript_3751/m.6264 type:complete len:202 (-) Transcript_3751:212-817(-)|eukprot:CAMPEP_0119030170 /NCGR_PEP_ID=MMETSP1176-20130426/40892_1 /TAXON_ID=265551 /ORGANISM="Synedropsis recta cf, Strain CCMP1620" /LENGTH=201 /DNA_ID=CAMNT_0006986535 /DNA_START=99 /DNA_END=704 /DNA_ORIENTATION=+
MFRKFDPDNDVSTSTQVKASVQRALKSQIMEANPALTDETLDVLMPKKPPLIQYKVGPHMMLYCRHVDSEAEGTSASDFPVFFQQRDGPILPTLKLIHMYPDLQMTSVTVDKGAIPFLLGGANIMCPGLTNPGGSMPEDTEEGPGVENGAGIVIFAEGKEHAIAVGFMTMSSAEIRQKNKGIGVEVSHFLGDGLYLSDEIH